MTEPEAKTYVDPEVKVRVDLSPLLHVTTVANTWHDKPLLRPYLLFVSGPRWRDVRGFVFRPPGKPKAVVVEICSGR